MVWQNPSPPCSIRIGILSPPYLMNRRERDGRVTQPLSSMLAMLREGLIAQNLCEQRIHPWTKKNKESSVTPMVLQQNCPQHSDVRFLLLKLGLLDSRLRISHISTLSRHLSLDNNHHHKRKLQACLALLQPSALSVLALSSLG